MSNDDKVVSITKNQAPPMSLPPAPGPYPGASGALKAVLDSNGFDEAMLDKGWVEIRVVARFTDKSALFHTVQARPVVLNEREDPAVTILKMVATANGWLMEALVGEVSASEADELRTLLKDVDEDHMLVIAMQDEGWESMVLERGLERVTDILEEVFHRYGEKVSGPTPIDGVPA